MKVNYLYEKRFTHAREDQFDIIICDKIEDGVFALRVVESCDWAGGVYIGMRYCSTKDSNEHLTEIGHVDDHPEYQV